MDSSGFRNPESWTTAVYTIPYRGQIGFRDPKTWTAATGPALDSTQNALYNNCDRKKKIIKGMGIDPAILGASRINGIKGYILSAVRAGKGFTESTSEEVAAQTGRPLTSESKIRRLEHELAYTKQELEFVKKIIAAGRTEEK